jgi:hypothetical protein
LVILGDRRLDRVEADVRNQCAVDSLEISCRREVESKLAAKDRDAPVLLPVRQVLATEAVGEPPGLAQIAFGINDAEGAAVAGEEVARALLHTGTLEDKGAGWELDDSWRSRAVIEGDPGPAAGRPLELSERFTGDVRTVCGLRRTGECGEGRGQKATEGVTVHRFLSIVVAALYADSANYQSSTG